MQLDLIDTDVPDAWKMGIFMREMNEDILMKNKRKVLCNEEKGWLQTPRKRFSLFVKIILTKDYQHTIYKVRQFVGHATKYLILNWKGS